MAVVRISQKLADDIVSSVDKLFQERISKQRNAAPQWGDRLYDIAMEPYRAHVAALPLGFFTAVDTLTVVGCDLGGTTTYPVSISHKLSQKRPVPLDFPPGGRVRRHGNYSYNLILLGGVWAEYHKEHLAWCTELQRLHDELSVYKTQVRQIVGQYSTLAPLLKQWPAAWELLPDYAKEKHKEIKERKPRAPTVKTESGEEVEVDLNKLTGAIVAHKLTR